MREFRVLARQLRVGLDGAQHESDEIAEGPHGGERRLGDGLFASVEEADDTQHVALRFEWHGQEAVEAGLLDRLEEESNAIVGHRLVLPHAVRSDIRDPQVLHLPYEGLVRLSLCGSLVPLARVGVVDEHEGGSETGYVADPLERVRHQGIDVLVPQQEPAALAHRHQLLVDFLQEPELCLGLRFRLGQPGAAADQCGRKPPCKQRDDEERGDVQRDDGKRPVGRHIDPHQCDRRLQPAGFLQAPEDDIGKSRRRRGRVRCPGGKEDGGQDDRPHVEDRHWAQGPAAVGDAGCDERDVGSDHRPRQHARRHMPLKKEEGDRDGDERGERHD